MAEKPNLLHTGHVFPFLWMHGEPHELLAEEIEKIAECGITSFCAESRTHEKFCEPQWWEDFGFVLEEAKKRNMTVWLLDDKHYPTGYANGAIERHPDLASEQVMSTQMDVCGPKIGAKILLREFGTEEQLLGVFAFPAEGERIRFEEGIDLSSQVRDGLLFWNVPAGVWRVIAVFTTHACAFWNYVDVLNPASADLMISEIYQPHYDHFKQYFGKTFVGFFSDEPRFGNGPSNPTIVTRYWTDRPLGVAGMAYPWSGGVLRALGDFDKKLLASLWWDCGAAAAEFRIRYMNIVTECYAKNFSDRLGNWCRDHGVLYTGHIIEDNGAHTMTGCSAGHFFRSMRGQDIAGIDVVYNVLRPGFSRAPHINRGSVMFADEKFYQFTLAKLASSAAQLEPRKAGRAMCEIFGAYGWAEGVTEMKWLVDHMLSRGINYFVPHAFNPLVDDTDCPPYFYNGGRNPQYSGFGVLMRYTERMCELLSGGESLADVAVLYHAEAEWSGLRYTKIDALCKALTEKQVLFDIVTEDMLADAVFEEGIRIGSRLYRCLIVPAREWLGPELRARLAQWKECVCTWQEGEPLRLSAGYTPEVYLESENADVRVLRYQKGGEVLYFLFNEGESACKNRLHVPETGYAELKDEMTGFAQTAEIAGGAFEFSLLPGEARAVRFAKSGSSAAFCEVRSAEIAGDAEVSVCAAGEKSFSALGRRSILFDVAEENTRFVGKVRFAVRFDFVRRAEERVYLDFGRADGALQAELNGRDLGERIASPFVYDVTEALVQGENQLIFTYSTTLALEKRDRASHFIALPKYGLETCPVLRSFAKRR